MLGTMRASAESTVYVFNDWGGGGGKPICTLYVDGAKVGNMLGSESSRINPNSWNGLVLPAIKYHKAVRPCILNKEGKTLFSIKLQWTNICDADEVYNYADECQIDIADGETYYIQLKRKGLTKMQFIELKAKDGEKMLKKNKYEMLPESVVVLPESVVE